MESAKRKHLTNLGFSEGDAYVWDGSQWVQLSKDGHTHPTLGNVNFTGTVSADGDEGLTGSRTLGGHTFTFKKGLLVGYE